MALFSLFSSQAESSYENKPLAAYTSAYRGLAPWGFATLDPTAALAAMGQGTAIGKNKLGADFKKTLQEMSADEKKGAQASQDALQRIRQRQESGQFLTPQETDFINTSLDKAFEYAHKTGYADWERGAQSLAGSRGLRTGDTPVAKPAMEELRKFELGLGSQRAKMGLDATLGMSQFQMQFDENLREFQESLMQNRWQARQGFMFGGGMQGVGNIEHTQKSTYSPSIMSNIGQTIGAVRQGMNLAGTAATGYSSGWSSMMPKG